MTFEGNETKVKVKMTMGEAINRLRALSHGDFKNAFYRGATKNENVALYSATTVC